MSQTVMTRSTTLRYRIGYKNNMAKHKYYVTTLWHAGAADPDIDGVYTAILGDAIARQRRMAGFDVAHFAGSNRTMRARSERQTGTPDGQSFGDLEQLLDIHPTHVADLASPDHASAVQMLLRRIMRHSHQAIYQAPYEGYSCPYDHTAISESAKATDCPVCGRTGKWISERRYFFRASAFEGRLRALYKYRAEFVQPRVQSLQVERLIERGLKDIAIGGKVVEGEVPWPDAPGYRVPTLLSELVGYLCGLGFAQEGHSSDDFRRYWPANLHVVGKNALVAHAVYWPAFLMAADLPVPRHIFAHGVVALETGTPTTPLAIDLVRKFGPDALRYSLLRQVPYGQNVYVSLEKLAACYDTDVVRAFGELAQRILNLVAQNCDGRIPGPSAFVDFDITIESVTANVRAETRFMFDHHDFSEGLKTVWSLIPVVDKALTHATSELHGHGSEKRGRFEQVLHDACQSLGIITLLLHPVLPRTTSAIWKGLGQNTAIEDQLIDETPWGSLRPGTQIFQIEDLFPPGSTSGAILRAAT